jgi:hypothetical protein
MVVSWNFWSVVIVQVWLCDNTPPCVLLPDWMNCCASPWLIFRVHLVQYSGGQASVGQGGFYGSGGARALSPDQVEKQQASERNKMLAMAKDVQNIRSAMQELEMLESLLRGEDGVVSSKRIELKNSIKKLMTAPEVLESLNNLEVQGEPGWGLSCEERELIIAAREKVNEC